MLLTVFLCCAAIGGTIMVCQFVMTLLGMGDLEESFDFDLDGEDFVDGADVHGSSWLFGALSFQTLTGAIAFFGLAGWAALGSGQGDGVSLLIGVVAGLIAMYSMYGLLRAIYRLQADGTQRIGNAVGQRGEVLIPLPPNQEGVGKVHVVLDDRMIELTATTEHQERLVTGTGIEVLEVTGPSSVLVTPVVKKTESSTS